MSRPQTPNVIYWYDFVEQSEKSNEWSKSQRDNFATEMCVALHNGKLTARDSSGFPCDPPTLPIPTGTVFVAINEAIAWMQSVGPFNWDRTRKKFTQKSTEQENAILNIIRDQGFNPTAFPMPKLGHHDSEKSKIREQALQQRDLFSTQRVFNSAWQRLRNSNKIVDAP